MFSYNGCVCDVCGKNFDNASDVVVCPECGTPHHRSCYSQNGDCIHADKHSEGFVWQAPEKVHASDAVICPKCQNANPRDTAFCESCGTALSYKSPAMVASLSDVRPQTAFSSSAVPKALEGEQDGVSYKDMAVYVGPSAPYYIFKFKRKQQLGKSYMPFCWSAFLFGPMYFLYRKLWSSAALCCICNLIVNFPTAILYSVQSGLIPAESALMFGGIETIAPIFTVIMLGVNLLWGFLAVPLYEKKVIHDIKIIKDNTQNEREYYQVLVEKAGPSRTALFCCIAFTIFYMFF
ncbi:MAG: RING finger protein [Oscillospiraceae bacterium]